MLVHMCELPSQVALQAEATMMTFNEWLELYFYESDDCWNCITD